MMLVEEFKKGNNNSLKEIQENTAKQVEVLKELQANTAKQVEVLKEETQKALKELQENRTKNTGIIRTQYTHHIDSWIHQHIQKARLRFKIISHDGGIRF